MIEGDKAIIVNEIFLEGLSELSVGVFEAFFYVLDE